MCVSNLPPAQSIDVIVNLCNVLIPLLLTNTPFYLFGDFNLPHIDWTTLCSSSKQSHDYFLNFCSANSLSQVIDCPTHSKGNILDLLLCNFNAEEILINTSCTVPPWTTDHLLISSTFAPINLVSKNPNITLPTYPNFKLGNYEKISEILSRVNWDFLLHSNNFQSKYDAFCNKLTDLINPYISTTHPRSVKPRRQPNRIKKLLKTKHQLYKKSKSHHSFKQEYKIAVKQYETAVNSWYDSMESNLCKDPCSKKFYGYVKSKLNTRHSIPPLKGPNSSLIFEDTDKANAFNTAFQKFFTADNNHNMNFPSVEHHMPPFRIEPGDIYSACMSMKRKLTRTPEGIPIYFLANTISSLLYALTILFNLSLSSNCIPSQWKEAIIVPVFKKGNRQNPDNYRPISLTSAICRLFETVLINKLLPFILERNLLSRYQFGFLPNRSSCSNILSSLHEWLASYSSSICTNVLYTDIKKAFDSVNHRLLVQALRTYGLNNDVVNWFQNFLSKRQQKVCINNSISSSLEVYSGVPQGSVSGPLLFLLMFNFISEPAINSQSTSIRLFADDAKVFGTDSQELQRVIDQMSTLLSTLQLLPSPKKCAILKIGKQSVINDTSFSIDNHPVQELPTFRELGVTE